MKSVKPVKSVQPAVPDAVLEIRWEDFGPYHRAFVGDQELHVANYGSSVCTLTIRNDKTGYVYVEDAWKLSVMAAKTFLGRMAAHLERSRDIAMEGVEGIF